MLSRAFRSNPARVGFGTVLVALVLGGSLLARSAGAISFIPIGFIGDDVESKAFAVSYDGLVVAGESGLNVTQVNAVYWRDGQLHALPYAGGTPYAEERIWGVNADGSVFVGESGAFEFESQDHAVAWRSDAGSGTYLTEDLSPIDRGYGVSGDGTIFVTGATGHVTGAGKVGTVGALVDLPYLSGDVGSGGWDIDASGTRAVGWSMAVSDDANFKTPVVWDFVNGTWQAGALQHLDSAKPSYLPSSSSEARGISPDGRLIVGQSNKIPVLWTMQGNGWSAPLPLGETAGYMGWANAVSDNGVVVGKASDDVSLSGAFVWDAVHGVRSVRRVLNDAGIDMTNWTLLEATDISRDGRVIVGFGINRNRQLEGWIARLDDLGASPVAVPEPPPFGFLTLALAFGLVIAAQCRTRLGFRSR